MGGAHFTSNTTSLFYTIQGPSDGPPVLLIHGWTCDQLDWSFQIPLLLSLGFQVLALDLRGHGRSAAYPSPANFSTLYSPKALAQDAAALLTHLNLSTPGLVMGHSLGSLVAAILAVEHPEQVRGLVLIDAAYYYTAADFAPLLSAIRNDLQKAPETVVDAWEGFGVYNERTPDWLKTLHKLRTWGVPAGVIAAAGEELYGKNDSIGRWENAKLYLKEGLGAKAGKDRRPRLAVVADEWKVDLEREIGLDEGAGDKLEVIAEGHFLFQQSAERFNGVLQKWLQEREFLP